LFDPLSDSKPDQLDDFLFGGCIASLSDSYERNADDIPGLLIISIRRREKRIQLVMVLSQNNPDRLLAPDTF